jgi:predicted amidohydrolase
VYNTHLVINGDGEIVESYRKLHLFDVHIENGPILMESNTTLAGNRIPTIVDTPVGKLGCATCYDLRFPEYSQRLRQDGAEILAYPSAFTVKTGQAHWEVLLRARAIETQCYVVAAAHAGQHNEKRASYGHAMVVDPWGTIVATCQDNTNEPTLCYASIDLEYLESIRTAMPVSQHRRHNLLG